ncbi:hypothetical protein A2851_02850 [Candidatus Kaiserbacteria bacterium RIFCSPHIGHO2_01_FULL_53_29]|uniref:Transposase IS200-like domain-containing protein n=1 Tax=Candidatus Kaiserbacteria bacterium RIFCSPHIGHO2_01_FULL_53_29 TaxID=1798480 RepID=A0A1F6CWH4_9BACT|nr:MAG: hypothetical protein A2851_02850 [Candidatus Kaiserbacteria bacterium RIFCSPHIGHO2_01_FULL_53_29]
MATRAPCVTDEWYHCYNRGVDKRVVFRHTRDYERFLALLYTSNGRKSEAMSSRFNLDLRSILAEKDDRGDPLVDMAVYCLMPSHVHLVVKQLVDGGIAKFMQKVFTAYTMYFNSRSARTGALFAGTYKAKHIDDDRYLKCVVPYVLLNPIELFQPKWREGARDLVAAEKQLSEYQFSSAISFVGGESLTTKITGTGIRDYYDRLPSLMQMLQDATEYHKEYSPEY